MKIRFLQVRRDDRGQGSLEYIGILAVVALVIGLAVIAFTAAGPAITTGVQTLVTEVFSQ